MDQKDVIAGRYRLEERIGRGGMGVVWRASDMLLPRTVALKQSRDPADQADRKQMVREAANAGRLRHEHVVVLHDMVFDEEEHPWLVMEYVGLPEAGSAPSPASDTPSPTLAELIAERPLPPLRAARIGAQIAEALAEAHRHEVVHRDVKPQNVLFRHLERDGVRDHALLGDFGIARHADATLTDSGTSGTPAYMSPEVAAGESATAASDVFSLGSTLYAAVTGSPPFGTLGPPQAIMRRVEECEIDVPPTAGPLRDVLERMLQKDPAARPTAREVAQLLRAVAGEAPPPVPPRSHRVRAPLAGRRHVRPWFASALVGGAVVVAVVLAVVMFLLPGDPDDSGPDGSDAAVLPAATGLPPGSGSLGDVRTADPCALIDLAVLRPYGETQLEPDWGSFERCDVFVEPAPGNRVDLRFEFDAPELDEPAPDTTEDVGVGRLIRGRDNGQYCDRILLLLDGNRVGATAEEGEPHANRCGIAEAAMQHAITVLRRGELPRRAAPFAPNSLAQLDACDMVDDATLSRVPDLDPTTAEREYAGWMCQWSSRTDDTWAEIRFGRNSPYTAADGDPLRIGDREARIDAPGYHPEGCTIKIEHRPYRDGDGETVNEVVLVSVAGMTAPPEEYCGPARELATTVVAALPPA